MIAMRMKSALPFAIVAAVILPAPAAIAAEAPTREILSSHIGWEVDKTTKGNVCTVESKHECQSAKPSGEQQGFRFPVGVAVDNASELVSPEHGDVYVADTNNQRVQVLTSSGAFVLMFGWDVNKTKVGESGASQAERNICTKISGNVCQAGVEGTAPGQFGEPQDVAVDPVSGDVYIAELTVVYSGGTPSFGERVQKFTAAGEFVLEIGKEVNETTKGNLCSKEEAGVKCKGPAQRDPSTPYEWGGESGAFNFAQGEGNLLAIGGSEDLLYVGDANRVQKFKANGTSAGEISLKSISSEPSSKVAALAVKKSGYIYLVYQVDFVSNVIREFEPDGKEVQNFPLVTTVPNAEILVSAIAFDPAGHLAVSEAIRGSATWTFSLRGSLYEVGMESLRLVTEFAEEHESKAIAFNETSDALYAVGQSELDTYSSLPVAEPETLPAVCAVGLDHETDATSNCDLTGKVNQEGVSETEVWFQWWEGNCTAAKPKETQPKLVKEAVEEVSVPLEGLRPNEMYCDRLASSDHNVKPPESPVTSKEESFKTPSVPPRIVGKPSVLSAGSSSAVMFGELNPENANTLYTFEYGPCKELDGCLELAHTTVLTSNEYGTIGATLEATGLQPNTTYYYRLSAENEDKQRSVSSAGTEPLSFTTAPAPSPRATTGAASAVGTTSVTVSGTADPDGQPATYTFELGRYAGTATQYVVVFSGSAGAGTVPVTETLGLSGLQPGTEYAYRIVVKSGYGTAEGEPERFTTAGLPSVLAVPTPLAMLAVPNIAFPKVVTPTTKALTNAQKLAKALKACKKRSKKQRAACQKQARKQYTRSKQANKRKKG